MEIIKNMCRSFPLLITIIIISYNLKKKDNELVFLIMGLFLNDNLNHIYKLLVKRAFGKNMITNRPINSKGCGLLPSNKFSNSMGMPSGHSCFTGFLVAFLWLKYYNNANIKPVLLFLLIVIPLSRTNLVSFGTGCHTFLQIIIGLIIGLINGTIFWVFIHYKYYKYYKKLFN